MAGGVEPDCAAPACARTAQKLLAREIAAKRFIFEMITEIVWVNKKFESVGRVGQDVFCACCWSRRWPTHSTNWLVLLQRQHTLEAGAVVNRTIPLKMSYSHDGLKAV